MIPAAACPRITITLEVTETLFDLIQVTAEMSQMTLGALVASALREKAIGTPRSRPIPAPQPIRQPSGEPVNGCLQEAILTRLDEAAAPSGVCDLREIRRTLPECYRPSSVSRAVSKLVRSGVLEPVRWSGDGFVPAQEGQLRFVRRK